MEAMIFAAGLGTRLRPLTNDRPKALVEIKGKTLLEWNILKMINFGIKKIVINVHHFPDIIINFIKEKNFDCDIIISDERDLLLDTGGGLLNAKKSFSLKDNILIHNVDVLSDVNFFDVENSHNNNNCLATLVVKERDTSRYLIFNENNYLCGWQNIKTQEKKITRENIQQNNYAFSCIQVVNPEIFENNHLGKVFSMIDLYLDKSKTSIIKPFFQTSNNWIDVGKLEAITRLEKNDEIFY